MYRALVNFAGIISMHKEEIREISNSDLVKSLLKAKYIEKIEEKNQKKTEKSNKIK